ncbi:TfoX family protein [bacterium]|nr:MAG: TfoX family protein [bacterium]
MSVSSEYLGFIKDQLRSVPVLSYRRMFGAVGIYSRAYFFAIVNDDVLYFKVDDSNRPDYIAAGSAQFWPMSDKSPMSYFEVPAEVLEDESELKLWADKAIAVARTAAIKKKPKR